MLGGVLILTLGVLMLGGVLILIFGALILVGGPILMLGCAVTRGATFMLMFTFCADASASTAITKAATANGSQPRRHFGLAFGANCWRRFTGPNSKALFILARMTTLSRRRTRA